MKNFAIKKANVVNFWKNFGNYTFFGLSLLCTILVVSLMWCNTLIFALGVFSSFIMFCSLKFSNIYIEDAFVRGGWALLNLSLFTAIIKLCCLHNMIDIYIIGCFIYIILGALFYSDVIPKVSYLLKLNNINEALDINGCKTKANGCTAFLLIYTIIFGVVSCTENSKRDNFLFEKETFVQVTKWEKEFYGGNTYFLVYCSKGKFLISPTKYPEIRNINHNTKIKVLKTGGTVRGADYFTKLEIKN